MQTNLQNDVIMIQSMYCFVDTALLSVP